MNSMEHALLVTWFSPETGRRKYHICYGHTYEDAWNVAAMFFERMGDKVPEDANISYIGTEVQ